MATHCPKCKAENPDTVKFCGECGTQLGPSKDIPAQTRTIETPLQELTRGALFANRYEIIEELGTGGMGKVYRVEDTQAKEEIALKLIKHEIAADKKTIDRFRNELTTARKIRHKNICGMYHLGEDKGSYYITMEYVPGEDLKSFIKRARRLDIGTAISLARQVCDGLAEAHGMGIVHRDLKPSNIMIDKDGNARIMDFGIARALKEKGITGAGVIIGTPAYMSPEQVEGKEVDQRSDIYSLGIILYEMVTGKVPFEGDTPFTVGVKHKSEIPQDPKELNPQIPNDLSQVILRCLEKQNENRFKNADEVRSELERIEQGIPTTERVEPKIKPHTSREITLTLGVKRLLLPALAVFAIAIIGLMILKPWNKKTLAQPLSSPPTLAVSYIENRTQEPDLDKNIMEMFTINLSRFEGIKIVSQQLLSDILSQMRQGDSGTINESTALKVAKQAGVDRMVVGSVFKVGNEIRMTAQLIEVEGGAYLTVKEAKGKSVKDIFGMVDQLTEELGVELGIARENAELLKIADVTTDSLEAFSHYQKGITHLWRWEKTAEAAEELQKAVDADPDFAAAYVYLSIAQMQNMGQMWSPYTDLTQSKRTLEVADRLSSKIGDKEKLMIDMLKVIYERNVDKAEEYASVFVEKYPDEKLANMFFSMAFMWNGKYEKGKNVLERYLEDNPADAFSYNILSGLYAFLGNHAASVSAIKKYIALDPDLSNPYDSAWEVCMVTGHYKEALEFCDAAIEKFPEEHWIHWLKGQTYLLMGNAEEARSEFLLYYSKGKKTAYDDYTMRVGLGLSYLYEGKLEAAHAEYGKALEILQEEKSFESMGYALQNLGKILTYQGKYDEAMAAFESAEKISWERKDKDFNPYPIFSYYHTGRVHVQRRDFASANTFAEKIKRYVQDHDLGASYLDYSYFLEGYIHAAQGTSSGVRDALDKCSGPQKNGPEYNELSALSSILMNEFDQAIEKYSRFKTNVYLSRYGNDRDFFYRCSSLADYNLGNVYELKGDITKAIEHYEKFLALWKDADLGIAEVDKARERLAAFTTNQQVASSNLLLRSPVL